MNPYHITLTSLTERIELGVLARDTVQALRIGISLMPACFAPTGITCKPVEEKTPCAA